MFNQDISVINKVYNEQTHKTTYKVSHIKGFWSSNKGIKINNVNLEKSDSLVVRILMSEKDYFKPKEYSGTGWTLKNDDYLVKGIVREAITNIAQLKNNYECMKIMDVAIKDYGSLPMQHFEVSGE